MNQILVTQKLYITPELKRKKMMYKIYFILSVFMICFLFSYYIYAEYDRNKSEELSQEILAGMELKETVVDNTTAPEEDIIVVFLDQDEGPTVEIPIEDKHVYEPEYEPISSTYKASNGKTYERVGIINIPSLKITYPILAETTDALLKISPCKFWGPEPNEVGNLCIVGHNYRNSKFFSKIYKLEDGDIIEITDLTGRMIQYKVYKQYIVEPSDVTCTSQLTDGKKEVTLITCTNDNKNRRIIKAVEYNPDGE